MLTVAVVYAVVGILGFFVADTSANILALNIWDHILHLATAAIGFVAAGGARSPVAA